jgi:squalene-associated FAD-dependent desaturase
MTASPDAPRVAVIGGGLAGLAAACALAEAGFRITLYERRPYLGGRASSYQHPGTGEVVDNCQHVLLGCCTNLLDFYRRTGAEDKIRWYDRLVFIEPGGRRSAIEPSNLPAPFHLAPSFLRARSLSLADKRAIALAMLRIAHKLPPDGGEPFLSWLRSHGQTERAIERFWKVVLVSALNEDLDRVSSHYAAQVFRESFLKSAAAGRMGVPRVPLTGLYGAAGAYVQAHGGEVQYRASVEGFRPAADRVTLCLDGREAAADFAVLAVPFNVLPSLLPQQAEAEPLRRMLSRFESSPITGIHLWFDREITELDHAVLLDRTIQWMFNKSKLLDRGVGTTGSYLELVVSSSKSLVERSRQEIIELALRELGEFFPAARGAQLQKSTVIKEIHATYSPLPGADAYRPGAESPWPRVFLAGDWTTTGWPATMEGAVRSGYRAAEALCRAVRREQRFLVPDLAARGFMRLAQQA